MRGRKRIDTPTKNDSEPVLCETEAMTEASPTPSIRSRKAKPKQALPFIEPSEPHTIDPSLSEEELSQASRKRWIELDSLGSKKLLDYFHAGKPANLSAGDLRNLMVSAAVARDKAYPKGNDFGMQIHLPAKLLKHLWVGKIIRPAPVDKPVNRESISESSEPSVKPNESERAELDELT